MSCSQLYDLSTDQRSMLVNFQYLKNRLVTTKMQLILFDLIAITRVRVQVPTAREECSQETLTAIARNRA